MLTSASRPPAFSGATPTVATPFSVRAVGRLPFALTMVVAAVLRLTLLSYAEYRGDDDDMVTAATQALQHGWLQSHGLISSVPVDNGPVAMWLLMLPLAVTGSLLAAHIWVGLLNVASAALCYVFVRDTWNRRLALIATVLYAVSPWAVIYSRRLWITAFDAPLALLAFWTLYRWLRWSRPVQVDERVPSPSSGLLVFPPRSTTPRVPGRTIYVDALLCGLAFSAFFQAHVVPMGEIAALLLIFLLFHRAFRLRPLLVFVGTLAVTVAPYVITTVIPALGKTLAGEQSRQPVIDGLSWFYFGHLVTGLGYQSVAPQGSRYLDATAWPFAVLDWLAVALLAAGCATTLVVCLRSWRRGDGYRAARAGILLVWALIPPLGLMTHLVEVHPYYFVVSMPAIYVLEGIGVLAAARGAGWLGHRPLSWLRPTGTSAGPKGLPSSSRFIAAGLTGLLVASQLVLAVPFFRVIPEYWSGADYGIPLSDTLRLVDTAKTLANGAPVVVGGYDHDVDYTLYSTLHRAYSSARYADDRGILEYATSGPPMLYLTTDDMSWETQTLRQAFGAAQKAVIKLPGEGRVFRFFQPSSAAIAAWATSVATPLSTPWRFGDLAEATGASLQAGQPGGNATVWLHWRLLRDPPQPLIMRLEVMGGDGYVWSTTQAVSYPAGYWSAGDAGRLAFVNRIDVPLPAYLPPGAYDVGVRLLGLVDGKLIGAPLPLGRMTVGTAIAPTAPNAALISLPHAQATAIAPGLTLAGWQADDSHVRQNGTLGVVLYWKIRGPVDALPGLQLVGADGAPASSTDDSELAASLPPSQWPAGRLLADRRLLHIGGRAAPGLSTLRLGAPGVGSLALTQVTIEALPRLMTLPPVERTAAIGFGGVVQLAGFDLQSDRPAAGQALRVTLYWQAIGPPSADETVFVHLNDANGKLVAQNDAPPAGGSAPTSTWVAGQVVKDVHTIVLPATLPTGPYRLTVGLYDLQTGNRLAITVGGPAGSTEASLGDITISGQTS